MLLGDSKGGCHYLNGALFNAGCRFFFYTTFTTFQTVTTFTTFRTFTTFTTFRVPRLLDFQQNRNRKKEQKNRKILQVSGFSQGKYGNTPGSGSNPGAHITNGYIVGALLPVCAALRAYQGKYTQEA